MKAIMKVFIKHFYMVGHLHRNHHPRHLRAEQIGAVRVFQGTETIMEELVLDALVDPKVRSLKLSAIPSGLIASSRCKRRAYRHHHAG